MLNKFFYDLHIHSALSPCGDDDNTPNNIVGMASLCGLDIVALTDHNTCKNCPAFFAVAEQFGIIPIAGMELTTSEDIHVVCLFENLDDAMRFDSYVAEHRVLIKNRPEFFGEQYILDAEEKVIGREEYLLTNATEISVDEVYSLALSFGGVAYPAHIDRESNSITAVLGMIPENSSFRYFELHDAKNASASMTSYGLDTERFIISSDAHYLSDMRDAESFFLLDAERSDSLAVRRELFRLLRGEL